MENNKQIKDVYKVVPLGALNPLYAVVDVTTWDTQNNRQKIVIGDRPDELERVANQLNAQLKRSCEIAVENATHNFPEFFIPVDERHFRMLDKLVKVSEEQAKKKMLDSPVIKMLKQSASKYPEAKDAFESAMKDALNSTIVTQQLFIQPIIESVFIKFVEKGEL